MSGKPEPLWRQPAFIVFALGTLVSLAIGWGAINERVKASEDKISEVKLDLRADLHRIEGKADRIEGKLDLLIQRLVQP